MERAFQRWKASAYSTQGEKAKAWEDTAFEYGGYCYTRARQAECELECFELWQDVECAVERNEGGLNMLDVII